MNQLRRDLGIKNSLMHIWGAAGSGKTLFAIMEAAMASRRGRVDWICTDGKTGFISILKQNAKALGGIISNIIVTVSQGHEDALRAIQHVAFNPHDDTRLVIVDPLTRVIDMSRRDDLLWGRELVEEALPILVALKERGIRVLLVSEVRYLEIGLLPVMYNAISRWNPTNLHITRGPGRHSTISIPGANDEEAIALLRVDEDGIVYVTPHDGGARALSESQSFV